MSAYLKEYQWAKDEPQAFWKAQAQNIDWFEFPQTILQKDEHGIERWFPDGLLNTSWLALDYHCEQGRHSLGGVWRLCAKRAGGTY